MVSLGLVETLNKIISTILIVFRQTRAAIAIQYGY